ncbi:type II RES/Xre toxin-antitoxin system antitoxin [Facilibium subflavum]|uniref:type II RES/Xre toxin-antitoxin system antitoxin n=1 Tax=Facilibium subflavum TaxID=2219058 RepID=UPI001F22EA6E|nr:antitoxin Xre/MbcA/ParS toxin-binding domain-containing protein [Facilibium subflavum]
MKEEKIRKNEFWTLVGIPSRGEPLYRAIHNGFSYEVFEKLAGISGLEKKQLAKITIISPASLNRRYKSGSFTEVESDKLYRYAELYKAALDLFEGNNKKATLWLRTPLVGLGNKKPVDMLRTAAETEAVLDFVGRLEHGVFS